MRYIFLALALVLGCSSQPLDKREPNSRQRDTGTDSVESDTQTSGICSDYGEVQLLFEVADERLQEISGIAISPTQDAFWTHNDNGETAARFYAVNLDDGETAGIFELNGGENIDWEDMAGAVIDGESILYFGDVGDNGVRDGTQPRENVIVYRVAEPDLSGQNPDAVQAITDFDTLTLEYPDEKFDCEAMMVDPTTGDIFLIGRPMDGASQIFRAPNPDDGSTTTLELVATVEFGSGNTPGTRQTTGAAIAPDRSAILVRTFTTVLLFPWETGQELNAAISKSPFSLPDPMEQKGEAIDFAPDLSGFYSVGEGFTPGFHFAPAICD